jgi:small subunit ribosomal protein S17
MTSQRANTRKVREGVVASNKMQKTLSVNVERTVRHPDFDKVVTRSQTYYAHVEDSQKYQVGQRVTIEETRPLSKLKRWRVVDAKSIVSKT